MNVFAALMEGRLRSRNLIGTLALVLVAAIAMAAVVTGLESRRGSAARLDRAFMDVGAPDLVVGGGPTGVPAGLDAAASAGLVEAESRFDAAFGSFPLGDGTSVGIEVRSIDDPGTVVVGRPLLRGGRWAESSDEIVLDVGVADLVALGDTIGLEIGGDARTATVVGFATDLSACFFPSCTPLRGYTTAAGLATLAPDGTYMRAHVRLAPDWDREMAAERLRRDGLVDAVATWDEIRADLLLQGRIFSAMLAGFGGFVLVSSLLVVANTATGSVIARRRELGVLRALGATPSHLVSITVLEHVVLGAVGVVVGWVGGSVLAPRLQLGLDQLGTEAPRFDPTVLLVAGGAVLIVVAVATSAPARAAGDVSMAASVSDAPTDRARSSRIAKLPVSPPVQLGFQIAVARPVRAALAATAIAASVAAGVAGWGVHAAVNGVVEDRAATGDPYDAVVAAPTFVDPDRLVERLEAVDGVGGWYTDQSRRGELRSGGAIGSSVKVRIVGPVVSDVGLVLVDGAWPTSPGEALVGWGLLGDGDVRIGETVDIELPEGRLTVTVVGRHADLDEGGEVLLIGDETFRSLSDASPRHWRVVSDGTVERVELARRLEDAMAGLAIVQPAADPSAQLRPFRWVLGVLVALVGGVAGANLVATVVAGARERRREIGVVRSLGFGTSELCRLALSSGAALGAVGVVIGLPVGLIAARWIVSSAVDQIGLGPGVVSVPMVVPSLVAGLAGVLAAAALSLLSTRSLRSMSGSVLIREG